MTVHTDASLSVPWSRETLLEVRTGKVKKDVFDIKGLNSAIFKDPRKDPVRVTKLGCDGDQQAHKAHGGPDKALLLYCASLYDNWKEELPQCAEKFNIGGFGENLVVREANDRNLCIGDKIAIGDEVVIQVAQPRAPCAKLNHRFGHAGMSRLSQTLGRTGIYMRVLVEGEIKAGDTMELLERRNPTWTIHRVQQYLWTEMSNPSAMKELIQLESLSSETKKIFQKRLDKGKVEDQISRLLGGTEMAMKPWKDYKVTARTMETPRICALTLSALSSSPSPSPVQPGSHVRLHLPGKLVRAYSVVSGSTNAFTLGIALDAQSRGGSKYIHETVRVGTVISASTITASFPLAATADHHTIMAGGIGITTFIAAADFLHAHNRSWRLHYAVRSTADIPFRALLSKFGPNVRIYDRSAGERLDVFAVLAETGPNTHVYSCGPQRLMDAVAYAAKECGIRKEFVHFEAFGADVSGDLFTVKLRKSERTLTVDADKSLLAVLREAGFDVDSSCEAGSCGSCRVPVCGGRVEHRGDGLTEGEKEGGMLSCVSRGVGEVELDM
ncbi:3-chlorobenzoate-3,4-dioxygenase reductase subunit [Patellaria atrata CBS 101060]|uniref:3-chlorobenzoate-3,4-dioxygenase reductase subunit n=1 Tax=Patellaria atrata CBS 101060 TaxID=1346257 RepID=A0A9P4S6D9_9PEZI|nr:3-chlorobenzoate-3,4-dioxygenase reductase subunit [Patellaria atrata CBS 101060]